MEPYTGEWWREPEDDAARRQAARYVECRLALRRPSGTGTIAAGRARVTKGRALGADWPVSQAITEAAKERVPGSTLAVLPGTGHCPTIENSFDFGEAGRAFLARAEARHPRSRFRSLASAPPRRRFPRSRLPAARSDLTGAA